jgi:hypothetical protein
MIHFGYFVLRHDGQLFPAGDDWGPTADIRTPGVSLGVKNGTEGIVAGIVKGAGAMRKGFDALVIVDQQPLLIREPWNQIDIPNAREWGRTITALRPRILSPASVSDFETGTLKTTRRVQFLTRLAPSPPTRQSCESQAAWRIVHSPWP